MLKHLPVIFLILLSNAAYGKTESHILQQVSAPIEILSYSASYRSPDRGIGDGKIIHRVNVKNTSSKEIVAYGIGLQVFDAFNRSLDRPFVGYDMSNLPVDEALQPGWEQRALSAYLFKGYGTGVAYVAIVRFRDGTIWKADPTNISNQVTDLELELEDDTGLSNE